MNVFLSEVGGAESEGTVLMLIRSCLLFVFIELDRSSSKKQTKNVKETVLFDVYDYVTKYGDIRYEEAQSKSEEGCIQNRFNVAD